MSIDPEMLPLKTLDAVKIIDTSLAELGSDMEKIMSKSKTLSESIKAENLRIMDTDSLLLESYVKSEILLKEQANLKSIKASSLERVNELNNYNTSMKNNVEYINKSIQYYKYCKNMLETKPDNTTVWFLNNKACPICMEINRKSAKLNHCQHLVCEECIDVMLNANPAATCPICCEQIISYEVFDTTIMRNKYIINNRTETINDEDNNDDDGQVFNFHPNGNIIDLDISTGSDTDTGLSMDDYWPSVDDDTLMSSDSSQMVTSVTSLTSTLVTTPRSTTTVSTTSTSDDDDDDDNNSEVENGTAVLFVH